MMQSKRNSRGFTMAELLIVVAITIVLSSVSFIAVQRYERGMAQLERDAIAKEIFVAAQNHITLANGQGYPGVTDFGVEGNATADASAEGIYYYAVPQAHSFTSDSHTALDLMLPFGSIDETVRGGGSYIIRYQKDPAVVLDVFYSPATGRYRHTLSSGEYRSLVADYRDVNDAGGAVDHKGARRDYGSDHSVIGWYGGASGLETGKPLQTPEIEVINAERLTVRIIDNNKGDSNLMDATGKSMAELKLIIEGETSHAMKAIRLDASNIDPRIRETAVTTNYYTVVLDDITANDLRFMKLGSDLPLQDFIPGENITISAVAYSNQILTNIAYSSSVTTNSLFADLEGDSATGTEASIANIRHLENLDKAVSGFEGDGTLNVKTARQTENLDWTVFKTAINAGNPNSVSVYYNTSDQTGAGHFKPVDLAYALTYDGMSSTTEEDASEPGGDGLSPTPDTPSGGVIHSISNVTVNYAGNSGLFGKLALHSSVLNLELIDFSITGTGDGGNAGALAGAAMNATFTNVLARNSTNRTAPADVTAGGDAGGLVGSMTGGTVEKCAAALTVRGSGDAGGLVGSTSAATTVTASYAGGHTDGAKYDPDGINVTGGANAGGLIGDATGATILYCYSTCSVSGATAGGLVGVLVGGAASSVSIRDSYCTGLVGGAESASKGAFAGALSGTTTIERCLYYGIVNDGLSALGGDENHPGITDLDADTNTYNAFVGDPNSDWRAAQPYDATLATYYSVSGKDPASRYNLKTVNQLETTHTDMTDMFVAVHYGDWPAPETLVVNTPE